MIESTEYKPTVCESCGTEFGCGAKRDGCWCNELTLSEGAANEIKAKFSDCICPDCLKKYASTEFPAGNLIRLSHDLLSDGRATDGDRHRR